MADKLIQKILVKLPVKLGDTIMASSFLICIKQHFPNAQLDVIMEKSIMDLKKFMPYIDKAYAFSKKEYPGPVGNYRYGKMIAKSEKYDLFFCLPFSFSSGLAGFFTSAKEKIGYATEHRGFLFSKSYKLPPNLHVVEDYVGLLQHYLGSKLKFDPPQLFLDDPVDYKLPSKNYVIVNVCSGPPSRFIPIDKSVEIIKAISNKFTYDIVLTGAPFEEGYLNKIEDQLNPDYPVINLAGKTSIFELGYVIKHAKIMVTTDSGNGHFANALDTKTVVLFGPGIQSKCHPYNTELIRSLQLFDLDCISCNSEHCKFGDSRCLSGIENKDIINAMEDLL